MIPITANEILAVGAVQPMRGVLSRVCEDEESSYSRMLFVDLVESCLTRDSRLYTVFFRPHLVTTVPPVIKDFN